MSDTAAPTSAPAPSSSAPSTPAPKGAAPPPVSSKAPPTPPAETPAAKAARKVQLKVDGRVEEVDLDSYPLEKQALEMQMGRAAQKRMAEAAKTQKRYDALVEALKKDPFAAVKNPDFGLDFDLKKAAEDRLLEEYQLSQQPESEREKAELQKRIKDYEAREAERTEAETQKQQAAMDAQAEQEIEREFMETLEASDLPKTEETVRLMAELALLKLEHGVELTPQQMAAEVRERMAGLHQHFMSNLSGEALIKHLGKQVVDEVLKYSVAKVRGQPAFAQTQEPVIPDEKPNRRLPQGNTSGLRALTRGLR